MVYGYKNLGNVKLSEKMKLPRRNAAGAKFLFCVIDGLRLAQEMNLDLTGVGKLLLDLLGDIPCQKNHLVFADILGLDHDAYLAAGLNGVAVGNAGEALRDFLKLLKTLDVVLDILAAGRDAEIASAA